VIVEEPKLTIRIPPSAPSTPGLFCITARVPVVTPTVLLTEIVSVLATPIVFTVVKPMFVVD